MSNKTNRLSGQAWWLYLDEDQRALLAQSWQLLEREKRERGVDYSFVVFPAAKAYEGFLKKLFYDTGLISLDDYRGKRFRIGRALNPSLSQNHWSGSVYERLKTFCGGEALPYGLWQTWKKGRNLLFHYFEGEENRVSLKEAQKRLLMIQKAIGAAFTECQPEKEKKEINLKRRLAWRRLLWFYSFLLIVWGFYRCLFRFPEAIEELLLKPLLWLGPVFWLVKFKEKRSLWFSLGFVNKNIFQSLFLGIGAGLVFAFFGLAANWVKYGSLNFREISLAVFEGSLLISLATAISEETVFRGLFLNRLFEVLRDEWKALLASSLGFVLIHLPITFFVLHYNPAQLYVYGVLVFFYSLGSGILFLRTGTIWASILMHLFWTWPIILFR